uniref:Uncharacterized protein n=1 Tax=Klebsiella pneumoniae TaxID=573 RepID=A0A8B0SUL9_KLEPN|nr:hypothetical protein [Klebsiella pneumoniae]
MHGFSLFDGHDSCIFSAAIAFIQCMGRWRGGIFFNPPLSSANADGNKKTEQ